TLVALAKQVADLGLAPRAAHPAEGIGDDPCGFDEPSAKQRQDRHQNARRIATGRSDEPRLPNVSAMELRKAVDRLLQEFGSRMLVAVEFLVGRGTLETEVGTEIDDDATGLQQGHGKLSGHAVRQRQKNYPGLSREGLGVRFGEAKGTRPRVAGESREHLRERLAGALAGRDGGELHRRMVE